jgi:hypothetical protein
MAEWMAERKGGMKVEMMDSGKVARMAALMADKKAECLVVQMVDSWESYSVEQLVEKRVARRAGQMVAEMVGSWAGLWVDMMVDRKDYMLVEQ